MIDLLRRLGLPSFCQRLSARPLCQWPNALLAANRSIIPISIRGLEVNLLVYIAEFWPCRPSLSTPGIAAANDLQRDLSIRWFAIFLRAQFASLATILLPGAFYLSSLKSMYAFCTVATAILLLSSQAQGQRGYGGLDIQISRRCIPQCCCKVPPEFRLYSILLHSLAVSTPTAAGLRFPRARLDR